MSDFREPDHADRCPFVPLRFDECAAFSGVGFDPETSLHQRLHSGVTCSHLTIGEVVRGRYYPRCELGDVAARVQVAARQPIGGGAGPTKKP